VNVLKKAAIAITLTLFLVAGLFVTLPAMAAPSGEQKVPVKLAFSITSSTVIDRWTTDGNISHRLLNQIWSVDLTIGDSLTPIKGTATVVRNTDYRYTKPGGIDQLVNDDYVFSFPTEGGGFVGHSHALLTNYNAGPPATYDVVVHALLQGTGAFKGQTLNAWQNGPGTTFMWEGFVLKPSS
jgi:hypothetical protein